MLAENTVVELFNYNIVFAKAIVKVLDLCYDFDIDPGNKEFALDLQRLCQYSCISTIMQIATDCKHYAIFVETGDISKSLVMTPSLKHIIATYKKVAAVLRHRFIKCIGCAIPRQPLHMSELIGNIRDVVLIASSQSPNNLNKLKKFIEKNRLIDIQQKIDQSVSVAKILLF